MRKLHNVIKFGFSLVKPMLLIPDAIVLFCFCNPAEGPNSPPNASSFISILPYHKLLFFTSNKLKHLVDASGAALV